MPNANLDDLSWQTRAAEAYAQTQAKIPTAWRIADDLLAPAWVEATNKVEEVDEKRVDHVLEQSGILSQAELDIVHLDVTSIVAKLQSGELSAVETVTAFCKSAAIAQQLYRCCTELFFDRALERAHKLDEDRLRTGKTSGPLHGLPVSLKDQYELKGVRTTIGLSSMLDHVGKHDAAVVQALESQGAVIFVKSNIPMSLMSADSVNNVWGRCQNPNDRTRTAGGSSGGEAVLSAAFASPVGIGSDIAGSCRIPSAMCGTYGLKPSFGRIPMLGGVGCGTGAEFVLPVLGPMSRSIAGLELLMSSIAATEPWNIDPTCVPMPWKPVEFDRPLRIGVMYDNGMVAPHPPILRMLKETAAKLQQAGHEVVEWNVGDMHDRAHMLAHAFFRQDGGATLSSVLKGEPILPNVDTGCPGSELNADEMRGKHWEAFGLRIEYRQRWNALKLDAVICPTASHAAVRHNEFNDVTYTLPWNLLQYCAAAMPVGRVEERDVALDPSYASGPPRVYSEGKKGLKPSRGEAENRTIWLDEDERRSMVGLPLSLQVVTPNYTDERCLAIARLIDGLVNV